LGKLKIDLWNCKFSHIYVEEQALNYEISSKIIDNFNNSKVVKIDHYKDVFCRSHQNFVIQKNSPKLILAVKKSNFVYKGSQMCDSFGNSNFYYTSAVMNCIYNCEYCYLQGMYPSGNIVIFVNIEDSISEIEKMLKNHPVYLCVSYDTDLMALEGITGFLHKWMDTAAKHNNLKIEIRTKSASFELLKEIPCCDNVILAWTLSPKKVIEEFEIGTPFLQKRLENICQAIDRGWKVRLCFDPLLYINNWKRVYKEFIDTIFKNISGRRIYQVSIGVFRISKNYLKIINKLRTNSKILAYPFSVEEDICSYNERHIEEMIRFVKNETMKYINENKIYI